MAHLFSLFVCVFFEVLNVTLTFITFSLNCRTGSVSSEPL